MKNNKEEQKKQKSNISTIILVAMFFIGVCILLYPAMSDFWNEKRQSQAVINYDDVIKELDSNDYAEDFARANELIDKLMFRYGMERHPEKAEISMEDSIESSCGFGYRIKN